MAKGFSVTFERWDEESVEAGDTDDRGFVIEDVTLGDAIRLGLDARDPSYLGHCEPNDSRRDQVRWLSFYKWNDGTCDYFTTGVEETRALHIPDHVTGASRRRIVRLFNIR